MRVSHPAGRSGAGPAVERPASLPVTRVSLYKNGVGFFEHTGHVSGNADVSIDFTTAQLNDVLQSLTAIDLNGGRISGAGYNSTTPLDQQLRSLPLALGQDPTAADFYAAIRGARVEVHAPGAAITGRLLSVEDRSTPATADKPAQDLHVITVVSDAGEVRTLTLNAQTSVRLLDTSLHQDVTHYLQLLANNRSQGLRHLTISDRGAGSRELRVSYISEVPIWKSTYRILFTDKTITPPGASSVPLHGTGGTPKDIQSATLQGWAVVDNTVGEDWTNVQLSLIAGAPQSFIQPLSDPIYSRRPEIPIATEAQLTPQTFESGNEDENAESKQFDKLDTSARMFSPAKSVRPGSVGVAGMHGLAGGSANGVLGGVMGGSGTLPMPAPPPSPVSYQESVVASTEVKTTTAAFDDFFAYNISDAITIRKNESALVPILQQKIDADRVTLVSSNGNTTGQPLRALWVTNTTGLTLDRGSFSIVENGNFGGEGLLDPIHAGERRLLSYAADQAVHVSIDGDNTTDRITLIRGSRGVVNIHRADVHELTFVIHNSAADHRSVITELPVAGGYKLDSTPAPVETTASVYRFRSEVDAGQTVRLHVSGRHEGYTTYYLSNSDDSQLTFLLNQTNHNPQFEAALQPVIDARHRVYDAQKAVDQTNDRLKNLRSEEDRQRANITSLAAADKSATARFVHDLNATEDQIKAAQTELAARQAALDAAKADLAGRIENFSINEKL